MVGDDFFELESSSLFLLLPSDSLTLPIVLLNYSTELANYCCRDIGHLAYSGSYFLVNLVTECLDDRLE